MSAASHRTKKLPATAKTQEGPSISRVSAYSMGAAALGRQGAHGSGSSADGTATSGLARFLGEANKQRTAAASGTLKSGPADLDKVREGNWASGDKGLGFRV